MLVYDCMLHSSSGFPADLKDDLADDAGDALVENLRHHQIEQALFVSHKNRRVVAVSTEVVERVGGAPEHVQTGAHAIRVVSQRVDTVLLRHHHRVRLGLLDEADEQADCGVLQGDCARHTAVRAGEVEEQVDGELAHDLVLAAVELLGQERTQLLQSGVGRSAQQKVDVALLKNSVNIAMMYRIL